MLSALVGDVSPAYFFSLGLRVWAFFVSFFLYRLSINLRGENIEPD